MQRINYRLFRGSVDKHLSVLYNYAFEADGDFPTIYQREGSQSVTISPSYGINISHGFERDHVFIPSNQYYIFASLLETAVKLISEHLYELFPNAGRSEFEINTKALERFQTEKAIANGGITIVPTVFVDDTSQCFPGLHINTLKLGNIKLPLQDAIPLSKMLNAFDPNVFSLSMLRILGKIE